MPSFLQISMEKGKIKGKQERLQNKPRLIYEANYNGGVVKLAISISDKGYIVGANPK